MSPSNFARRTGAERERAREKQQLEWLLTRNRSVDGRQKKLCSTTNVNYSEFATTMSLMKNRKKKKTMERTNDMCTHEWCERIIVRIECLGISLCINCTHAYVSSFPVDMAFATRMAQSACRLSAVVVSRKTFRRSSFFVLLLRLFFSLVSLAPFPRWQFSSRSL